MICRCYKGIDFQTQPCTLTSQPGPKPGPAGRSICIPLFCRVPRADIMNQLSHSFPRSQGSVSPESQSQLISHPGDTDHVPVRHLHPDPGAEQALRCSAEGGAMARSCVSKWQSCSWPSTLGPCPIHRACSVGALPRPQSQHIGHGLFFSSTVTRG